ncbi:alkaline phosphatase family protein [Fluviicola sp.]|jgi:predicted AlkP superfamily pyrophosphatase or phosphodiesterase|uniref:alkaline phosphatase family protein n=1 Tax=Fluviicola sp. TaxID=1917219 RepID=UPI002832B68F|nr:alkaline phosphatase family protein [Fluviicola sp.]MDR0802535.1 alkaline phosphatase family protein [Fluviicola sp.]
MTKLLLSAIIAAGVLVTCSFDFQKTPDIPTKEYHTEYVIVLIIDGPRYTETFGDTTCKYIPHLGNELKKEGVLFSNFRNNGPTFTISGHTAIMTGRYQHISNSGKQLPKHPSMFQYYLKEKNVLKSDAWVIASKGKLEVLGNTLYKKWWNVYKPSTYCGPNGNSSDYAGDPETFDMVKTVLSSEKPPHLMLINLLAVDTYAHSKNWEMYLKSIQNCDNYAFQLWNLIQSNNKLKDKTALLITSDHGRHLDGHKDGYINHGDGCEGCRHISLLAMGPDFKKNVEITTCAEQLDISKTISEILHFSMPTGKGRVLTEMLN